MAVTLFVLGAILAVGATAAYSPMAIVIALIAVSVVSLLARVSRGLLLWQKLMILALAGYMVLNYGFANLTIPGTPVPVGHLLMFGALFFALPGHGRVVRDFVHDPVMLCWGALLGLTLLPAAIEVPRYGGYALRDASMVVEGIFLLLGYIWASHIGARKSFLRMIGIVFAITIVYCTTYSYGAAIRGMSPKSGVFLPVAIVGNYNLSDFIAAGLLLFWLFSKTVLGWPRILTWPLMLAGLFELLMMQVRSTYVGLAAALVLVIVLPVAFGLKRRALIILLTLPLLGVSMLMAIALSGIKLQGRTGPVQLSYFSEYARSFTQDDVPGAETREWRRTQWRNVIETTSETFTGMLLGQGFGQPLTKLSLSTGAVTRQPHNIHISVFGRLGLLGLIAWFLFHISFYLRGYSFLKRTNARETSESRDLVTWLMLSHVVLLVSATFGAVLEFSDGAIPFYVLMGFALRVSRFPLPQRASQPAWHTYPPIARPSSVPT
jgi:O-antigen ligase